MTSIIQPRAIIDRAHLSASLTDLAAQHLKDDARDQAVHVLLRGALESGRAEITRRFLSSGDPLRGRDAARDQSYLIDQLLRCLYDFAGQHVFPSAKPSAAEHLSLLAVGGYGRGELAPYSDIDLLFIAPYKFAPRNEQIVEYILYRLWDLGLKVGHAARTLDESVGRARDDMTIRTALLEARYIWGDQQLYDHALSRFWNEVALPPGLDFVEAKLAERDQRHAKHLDSRYAVEPQIKDGKGGLRDLHTLYWIAKYLYRVTDVTELPVHGVLTPAEAARFDRAEAFLWRLRWHLHLATGRAEEKLTFDLQKTIAQAMGYADRPYMQASERLMKHYFLVAKSVGDLTRIFCAGMEAAHRKLAPTRSGRSFVPMTGEVEGFVLDGGRLGFRDMHQPIDHPIDILRLFAVAQSQQYAIHPDSLRWITRHLGLIDVAFRRDPAVNAMFLSILTAGRDPEATLRRLSECGFLGRFIPDFGRVVAQMQFDMYHHYTVDEHTLFAIGLLYKILTAPAQSGEEVLAETAARIQSRRALFVAIMLHDIAKGRGGDHSDLGAAIARRLGPRLTLTAEETETAAWLVRHHLLLSNTAFRRDLDDPKTVIDFANQVQSLERLRLLYLLTVADIRAVGPGTWNSWKSSLLQRLFRLTEAHLSGQGLAATQESRLATVKVDILAARGQMAEKALLSFLDRAPADYLLSAPIATILTDARMVLTHDRDTPFSTWNRVDADRGVTVFSIYTEDRPGLMARLTAAFATEGMSIAAAQITTLADGYALDRFALQDAAGQSIDPSRLARLHSSLKRSLNNPLPDRIGRTTLSARQAAFDVAARVLIDNTISATHSVIEVNGADRPGILYRVTRCLTTQDLRITSAKINTFGARIVDVFYVKDRYGLKIDNEERLKQIRAALIAVLEDRPMPDRVTTDSQAA